MARRALWFGIWGAFALPLLLGQVSGQSASDASISAESAQAQDSLAELETSMSLSADKIARLKAEIAAMQGNRDKQNAALIAASERVKLAETDVDAVEQKIGDLIVQELETRGRLDGSNSTISGVLAALERISRSPPPALIVDPSGALNSARSAILISAILPQLQAKADAVMGDLNHLNEIKAAAQEEEGRLKANFDILEEEQLRIATLIAAQKQTESTTTADIEAETARSADLAAKADQLKALIDTLSRKARAVATAAEATAAANSGGATPRLDSETVRLALANTERTEPAIPFVSAKGYLALPTNGVAVTNYGDGDGLGGISKGVAIVTRASAPVLAPADGWVIYKGDYLNYGQIVILDAGQDYSIVLAGLGDVTVNTGQFVRLGAEIGVMGSRSFGRAAAASAGQPNPTLYIEMRKNSIPIDPTGWWATPDNATQSG